MTRRTVRVDPQFFGDLDAQLRHTRGPNGGPSASDFLLLDLPTIAEVFAESFDELPAMFDGSSDYRNLVTTGSLVVAPSWSVSSLPAARSCWWASTSTWADAGCGISGPRRRPDSPSPARS